MKLIVGKRYKCAQPLTLHDYGISGRNAIENCKNNIVTVDRIKGDGVRIEENGWWIRSTWLEHIHRILKYNRG